MKAIELEVNLDDYFNNVLVTLKPLTPFKKLRDKELKVLAQLLYYAYKYKSLPNKEKFKLVFDYDTRQDICNKLNIPIGSFNNTLTILRTNKILEGRTIKNQFLLDPDKDPIIAYKFIVHN
jgi:hypothetical protein